MPWDKLQVVVIDDEDQIREALVATLSSSRKFKVTGQAKSVDTAYKLIVEKEPKAVFLDIKLIGGDAFMLMNKLDKNGIQIPPVILNTGYNTFEYAQKSLNNYREYVVKILHKPFWDNWKDKEQEIVNAILKYQLKGNKKITDPLSNRYLVKSNYQSYIIRKNEIVYIKVDESSKSSGKIVIRTFDNEHTITTSLSNILKDLNYNRLIRINRFCAVNLDQIVRFDHSDQTLFLDRIESPFAVGDRYLNDLKEYFRSIA